MPHVQPRRCHLEAAPRAARLRYYTAVVVVAALATLSIGKVFRVPLAVLALLAIYAFGPLRADHAYHVHAAQLGCKPAPCYPWDVLGIRHLVQTARALRENVMLERRKQTLDEMGHTYLHGTFPDWHYCVTSDEPENVKAVLAGRFTDWDLPAIRIKSFLPVLGRRELFSSALFLSVVLPFFSQTNTLVSLSPSLATL